MFFARAPPVLPLLVQSLRVAPLLNPRTSLLRQTPAPAEPRLPPSERQQRNDPLCFTDDWGAAYLREGTTIGQPGKSYLYVLIGVQFHHFRFVQHQRKHWWEGSGWWWGGVCLQVQGSAFWRIIHLCAQIRSVYRWVDTSGLELGLSKQSRVVLCESSGGGKAVSASAGAPKQKQNLHQHGRAHVKAVWEGMPLLYGYMKKMGKTKGGMRTWARCRFQWV